MAEISERSFPFDAEEINGEYDRVYYAEDWRRYFKAFISSGTFMREPDNLQIIANGDMSVTLRPGAMIIEGARYDNENDIIINLEPADGVLSRIDRIVITMSKTKERDNHYEVLTGEYSYSPKPPECRRTADNKDYVLADIEVHAGAIKIDQTNIIDQRLNSEVCGLAIPFANIDTSGIFLQLQAFYEKTEKECAEWQQEEKDSWSEWLNSTETQGNAEIAALIQQFQDFKNENESEITAWLKSIKEKGNTDLAVITQQLLDFRNENESEFIEWFEKMKELLGSVDVGKLATEMDSLSSRLDNITEMLYTGMAMAKLGTEDGDFISDDLGRPILAEWPICKCHS